MKKICLFFLFIHLLVTDTGYSKISNSDTIYFPIQVGSIWYYENPDKITSPWDILTISDSIQINSQKYYLWERGPGANVSDTICYDSDYNVLRYIDGETHLWFDFTQDSGAVYTYAPPDADFGEEEYAYQVHVYRNVSVETSLKSFSDCIEFLFDIPQVIDEEHTYIFAPDVGLVIEQANGWWTNSLHDYQIGNTSTSTNNRETIINDFRLYQNYPNPFNPETTIQFDLPRTTDVRLEIFNLLGQRITILFNEQKSAGHHSILWNGKNNAGQETVSGLYLMKLTTNNQTLTKKMFLLR